ncbi:MAG: hypothetical protein HQL71_05315 [Magnetococcales bacterium]|nr:hypothetical protein [Magnetococcales bacterium]
MLNSIQTNNHLPHLNGVVDKYNNAKFDPNAGKVPPVVDENNGPGFAGDAFKKAIDNKINDLFSRYPNGGVEQKSHALGIDVLT